MDVLLNDFETVQNLKVFKNMLKHHLRNVAMILNEKRQISNHSKEKRFIYIQTI